MLKMLQIGLALWLTVLLRHVICIRVFSFNSTDESDQLSSVVLVNSPRGALPEKFTFCFAMRQDKIDQSSPLLIRDKNKQPWIAPSIWHSGGITLWFEIGKREWLKFHQLEKPWKFWSHICTEIDTVTANISVSLDGRPALTRSSKVLREEMPGKLQLELGFTESLKRTGGTRPFHGQVSNIQFHFFDRQRNSQLAALSKNPCEKKGSYLAWSEMTFTRRGQSVFELEENNEEVCDILPQFYNVLLHGTLSWTSVNHLCKVLGGGRITGMEDEQDVEELGNHIRSISESCRVLWLPLSDGRKEGVWENTNSNTAAKFLKWIDGQPNGLADQNHAGMDMESFLFGDYYAEDKYCASCTLETKTLLTLRGVCKDSYLGKPFKNFLILPHTYRYNIYGHS